MDPGQVEVREERLDAGLFGDPRRTQRIMKNRSFYALSKSLHCRKTRSCSLSESPIAYCDIDLSVCRDAEPNVSGVVFPGLIAEMVDADLELAHCQVGARALNTRGV